MFKTPFGRSCILGNKKSPAGQFAGDMQVVSEILGPMTEGHQNPNLIPRYMLWLAFSIFSVGVN